jgi:tRNA nucleotidyltransferase/poly(A) polymerase
MKGRRYSKSLTEVFRLIKENKGEARFVGGAVRDFLLGGSPPQMAKDIDLAVNLPPEFVAEIFTKAGAKVVSKYATNIVILRGEVFEMTSTRKDENCDGRYATMIFTPSFEEDAKRRDFTINALYMTESGEIFDYHGGKEDLQHKRVKFIGNPEFRIEEDYLRIWRFFRFSCLYGNEIDALGFQAVIKKKEGLKRIAKERVTHEMLKLLAGEQEKIYFILGKMLEAEVISKNDFFLENQNLENQNLENSNFQNKKLQNKNLLPKSPVLRLLCLTNCMEVSYFAYTKEQKRLISIYNKIRIYLKNVEDVYYYKHKMQSEIFTQVIELGTFFSEIVETMPDFSKLEPLPFSFQEIMDEGYEGVEISKEYDKRLKNFIKNIIMA